MGCCSSTDEKSVKSKSNQKQKSNVSYDNLLNYTDSNIPMPNNQQPILQSNGLIPINVGEFDDGQQDKKVLLLGSGECGKTTIWKQLKITDCGGFDDSERESFIPGIKLAILFDMKLVLEELTDLGVTVPNNLENDKETLDTLFQESLTDESLTDEVADMIYRVWNDPQIQHVYKQVFYESCGIGENAPYFFENVMRISDGDYIPSDEDILKIRIRTTGMSSMPFIINHDIKLLLVDLGGQISERGKWRNGFKNTNYIMYVISLSDFDQKCFDSDDYRTNDSLSLFQEIANQEHLKSIPFFLILNKTDLFKEKLSDPQSQPQFKRAYPDYEGEVSSVNYKQCLDHIKKTYLKKAEQRQKGAEIIPIETCAMDKDSISDLFQKIAFRVNNDNK